MSKQNFVENKLYLFAFNIEIYHFEKFHSVVFLSFFLFRKNTWYLVANLSIIFNFFVCYRFIIFESFWKFHSNGFNSVWYMIKRQQAIKMFKEKPKSVWYFWTCPSNIIKLPDKISIENCLFVGKSLNNQLPKIFNNWFVFSSDTHKCETSCSEKGMLKVKSFNTKSHGKQAVTYSAINTRNSL